MSAITGTYLDDILAHKRHEVEERYAACDVHELRRVAEARKDQLSLSAALKRDGVQVIAEIKRRSPSKGEFKKQLDPVEYADAYLAGGAAAISVLTDGKFFGGSLQDLRDVHSSSAHDRGLVILQKEFIVDERQLLESAAAGSDAVLLIVAALDERQLGDLQALATALGLEALVEVHDEAELETALSSSPRLVGVNNRDLRTFTTDLSVAERILPGIPGNVVGVAESGISSQADVQRLSAAGAGAVLVGESLMLADDPAAAIGELRGC